MQNLTFRVVFFGMTLLMASGSAHSQILDNFGGSATAGAMTVAPPPAPVPEFKWDYRFDAQYNSTIKPYLRWYRRQGNTQHTGVRYPYYHGPQPYYGTGYGSDCSSCGGTSSGYINGYVQPRRSSWFNPYGHMNQGQPMGVPGDNQGVLQYLSNKTPKAASSTVAVKTAWIKHESATDSISVFYQSPAEQSRDEFYEARVTTRKGKLVSVDWVDAPTEPLTAIVARYQP